MGVGFISSGGIFSLPAGIPLGLPRDMSKGPRRPPSPLPPGSAGTPTRKTPAAAPPSGAATQPPPFHKLPVEWVQHLYETIITFAQTSYRLIAEDVPEVIEPTAVVIRARRVEDLLVALLHYSLNVYIATVKAALEERRRTLVASNPSHPHKELCDNLLRTRPTVPEIVHAIACKQLAELHHQSSEEERHFFESTGKFATVIDVLQDKYHCLLEETEEDCGKFHSTDMPSETELRARIAKMPSRLWGPFVHARRLRARFAQARAPDQVTQIIRDIVRQSPVPRVEDIPYVSLFLLYNPDGNLQFDGGSGGEALYRVMIEQWQLRAQTAWSQVSAEQFDQGHLVARQALLIFTAITQIAYRQERTPAGLFDFLGKVYALNLQQITKLNDLAHRRDFRQTLSVWKDFTKTR